MSIRRQAGWATVVGLLVAEPAYGYVDPGSASFVVQILVGTLLGILFAVKLYWQKIKAFLRRGGRGAGAEP